MSRRFSLPKPDSLVVTILLIVVLAFIFPARGWFADAFKVATDIAIGLLFFFYGARLSPQEARSGLTHWRLHLTILSFTFIVFPIIGVAAFPLKAVLSHGLFIGIVYLTLIPSTVQSSIAFTSIAYGNVSGAIVSASLSNLLGVIITPLLVMLVLGQGSGVAIGPEVFIKISLQLLVPFFLGQFTQKWTKRIATTKAAKLVDRGSIVMVVYSAFSAGVVKGIWKDVTWLEIILLSIGAIVLVCFMLWLTRTVAARLGFSREDQIAIQFCGTKKSLTTGLPMGAVIFGTAQISLIIVPVMLFHQLQLLVCAMLASRYAQQHDAASAAGNAAEASASS